jgi:hypothetical protein
MKAVASNALAVKLQGRNIQTKHVLRSVNASRTTKITMKIRRDRLERRNEGYGDETEAEG